MIFTVKFTFLPTVRRRKETVGTLRTFFVFLSYSPFKVHVTILRRFKKRKSDQWWLFFSECRFSTCTIVSRRVDCSDCSEERKCLSYPWLCSVMHAGWISFDLIRHSFIKHLLSTYFVSGSVLSTLYATLYLITKLFTCGIGAIKTHFSNPILNPKRWCCEHATLNMPANLENSAVATGLENCSFHFIPKNAQTIAQLHWSHMLAK